MEKKICIFYNPEAGKKDQEEEVQRLKGQLEAQHIRVEIQNVLKIGDLKEFVDKTLEDFPMIGIAGGDGTLRDFLGSIVELKHHDIKLLVVPMGTGNDFVRNFEFSDTDPVQRVITMFEKLEKEHIISNDEINDEINDDINDKSDIMINKANIILEKQVIDKSDVIETANAEKHVGNKKKKRPFYLGSCNHEVFASVSSTGIDAQITANSNKNVPKRATSYILSTFATLFRYKSKYYQIRYRLDGEEKLIEGKFLLIAMGNTKYYGRGMKIVPNADPTQKKLGICLIDDMSPFRLMFKVPTLFKGTHVNLSFVHNFYADEINIIPREGELLINLDGDVKTVPSAHYQKIQADHIEIF